MVLECSYAFWHLALKFDRATQLFLEFDMEPINMRIQLQLPDVIYFTP